MTISPLAGKPAPTELLVDVPKLLAAYVDLRPDPAIAMQRVAFGTSGHRGISFEHAHDFLNAYVGDLGKMVDFDAIRGAGIRMGVDPLGGAGVHYWAPIAERYQVDLTVLGEDVDPTFAFMTADWDGKIRIDPSSSFAMRRLIDLKDRDDIAFACDTDHDRHGIVTRSAGLLPPNHYLSVLIDYLFRHRPQWAGDAAVGCRRRLAGQQAAPAIEARLAQSLTLAELPDAQTARREALEHRPPFPATAPPFAPHLRCHHCQSRKR